MITISSKAIYGLAAMVDLGSGSVNEPQQSRAIAERQGIPAAYLERLLNELKRGGFVRSVRGAQGGYLLARPTADIMVRDILVYLEGPIVFTASDAKRGSTCVFWEMLEFHLQSVLEVSLESVVVSQQAREKVLTYRI